jgi:hypothetical protein
MSFVACSSKSGGATKEDSGTGGGEDAGVDQGSPTVKDSGPSKDTGSSKDTGPAKDAPVAKDAPSTKDVETKDVETKDVETTDAEKTDAEKTDAETDAAKDSGHDAHDAAMAAAVQNYFMGRWDTSAVTMANEASGIGAVAEWAGSGIITTFTGPNFTIELNETCAASIGSPALAQCDSVALELDGKPVSATAGLTITLNTVTASMADITNNQFTLAAGMNTITVSGIGTGTHTLGTYKNTDPTLGGTYSLVKFVPAANGTNPAASYSFAHHIEWIGDDDMAGVGALNDTTCSKYGTNTSNSIEYQSAARIVSEYFNAERQNLSFANVGVYESDPPSAMGGPAEYASWYPLVVPDQAMSVWNFANFDADLVVVDIGGFTDFDNVTADTSGMPSTITPTGFVAGYEGALETLLTTIRSKHASAFILVTIGPAFGGNIQPADANTIVQAAVTNRLGSGETSSTMAFLAGTTTGYSYAGCDARAAQGDQQTLATALENQIKTSLNWTAATFNP